MKRYLGIVETPRGSQNQLHIARRGPGASDAASRQPVACLKAVPIPVRTGLARSQAYRSSANPRTGSDLAGGTRGHFVRGQAKRRIPRRTLAMGFGTRRIYECGRRPGTYRTFGCSTEGRPHNGCILDAWRNRLHRGSLPAEGIVRVIFGYDGCIGERPMTTKAKPQKQAEKAAPAARNTKTSPEGDDVYELLLAELEARRVRLRSAAPDGVDGSGACACRPSCRTPRQVRQCPRPAYRVSCAYRN